MKRHNAIIPIVLNLLLLVSYQTNAKQFYFMSYYAIIRLVCAPYKTLQQNSTINPLITFTSTTLCSLPSSLVPVNHVNIIVVVIVHSRFGSCGTW